MGDALGDEIESLVSDAKAGSEQEDDSSEAEDPKPKRVKKRTSRKKEKARTIDEIDRDELLPDDIPKAGQNIKSLGDMYAKYGIGERPDFKLYLYRTYPKIAPGGIKFDGFYDEYDIPLMEQQIQADYGGGSYRITIVGPHPTNPRIPKHYESQQVQLAGEPNFERMPRALQKPDKPQSGATNANPPPMPMAMPENPKIVEAALKMFDRQSEADRAERRRQEDKFEEKIAMAQSGSSAVADAERRRADDLIAAERERANTERSFLEKRMDEMKREQEAQQRRLEAEARSRPSMAEELRSLAPLFQKDDSSTKEILSQILQKHRDEVSQMQTQHADFVRDVRQGHQTELQSLRQSHQREIEAERQASRSREERIEERLRSERDERERDRQRHKEAMDERDRHWKDRMDSSLQMQNTSWEARHQAQVGTYENRIQWLQQEIDKLNSEIRDLKGKQEDKGDIFQQLTKYREFQGMIKDFGGGDSSAASAAAASGGIGLSGGDDWKSSLAEGLAERAPQIFERLFSPGGAAAQVQQPPQQQMQEYKEGQVVDTPQGPMEVVRNPADGQLALAPKAALDAHRAQIERQQQGGGILGPGAQPQRRRRPRPREESRERSRSPMAVPDLRGDLPRPTPPWEGGTPTGQAPAPPEPPPPMPRSATRSPRPTQTAPLELSHQERQGLQVLAKEVHQSVQRADEPEEFVQKMLEKYPVQIIQQIVGRYTDGQIAQGIRQLEPNSAGATPAGMSFIRQAFALVRKAVQ